MDKSEWGYIRGITECTEMLETLDVDACVLRSNGRSGNPQINAGRKVPAEILTRGNTRELEGFCTALTEIVAIANEHRDHSRMLSSYADRRAYVAKRWLGRQTRRLTAAEVRT